MDRLIHGDCAYTFDFWRFYICTTINKLLAVFSYYNYKEIQSFKWLVCVCLCVCLKGTLMDCYDELGNRYQLPVYVLSAPINLLREGSEPDPAARGDEVNMAPPVGPSIEVPIKLLLSTGKHVRLTVHSTDTIGAVKRQVQAAANVDARRLRIFFAGKQLLDRQRISDAKIHRGYTLQVVVAEHLPPTTTTATSLSQPLSAAAVVSSADVTATTSVTVVTVSQDGVDSNKKITTSFKSATEGASAAAETML